MAAEKTIHSADDYRASLLRCYAALVAVACLPLDELAEMQEHAETVAPFVDPTLWVRNNGKMREDREVVRALQASLKSLPDDAREMIKAMARVRQAREANGLPPDNIDRSGSER